MESRAREAAFPSLDRASKGGPTGAPFPSRPDERRAAGGARVLRG